MDTEREKLGAGAYVVGGLSYIPLIGVLFGIIAIIWGVVTKKLGGRKLAFIGTGGIAFTAIIYGGLFYLGFVQRGGLYDHLRAELAKTILTSLVQSIEFYKTQHGNYPASLKILEKSLPEAPFASVRDPTDTHLGETRFFYYQLEGKDHYYLLGVGADGQPFTSDDIHPVIKIAPNSGIGLLIKKQ